MSEETYYKLATWVPRLATFQDGKRAYPTYDAAKADAKKPGRYRVSEVTPAGRSDAAPFDVAGTTVAAKAKPRKGGLRDRPGPWNMRGANG